MPQRPRLRLDAIDQKLLDLLQEDAARSLYALGDEVGLSPSAVQRRITRYRKTGLIMRQAAILDPEALPGTVLACVLVTLERESKRLHSGFQERMRATPEVQQCYDLAGNWDYLVIMVASGMPHCRSVIDSLFLGAPNIKRYDTLFIFDVIKSGLRIPLTPAQNLRARSSR
jgi:Lrp/AsnC family leucine-responsive transcriptional regulator